MPVLPQQIEDSSCFKACSISHLLLLLVFMLFDPLPSPAPCKQAPLVYYFGDVSPDKQADLYKVGKGGKLLSVIKGDFGLHMPCRCLC